MTLDHLPGRSLTSEGKEWLYFSGTAYLGLAWNPTFLAYLHEGIQRYGANFGGLSALLTMLNSCASGIGVVNIDNGFGAAILAGQILHTANRLSRDK